MSIKCPVCYQALGTWTHDPILRQNGCPYRWIDETTLETVSNIEDRTYKGLYQIRNDEIIELQNYLKELEEDNLDPSELTVFSPINTSGYFPITGFHIKELRDSVEKLLIVSSLTKTDYFNYDADNNHIIHPRGDKEEWTDPITDATDLVNFQVKDIHIEDLRHYISQLYAKIYLYFYSTETWNPETSKPWYYYGYKNGKEVDTSFIKFTRSSTTTPASNYINACIDDKYLYIAYADTATTCILTIVDKTNQTVIATVALGAVRNSGSYIPYFKTKADSTHIYIWGYGVWSTSSTTQQTKIWKIQKENLSAEPPIPWALTTSIVSSIQYNGFFITKDYVCVAKNGRTSDYVMTSDELGYYLYTNYAEIKVLNKLDLSTHHTWTSEHYNGEFFAIPPSNFVINKFTKLDESTSGFNMDTITINNDFIFSLFCKNTYIRQYSGGHYSYTLNASVGEFVKNTQNLVEGVEFTEISELTITEVDKYWKIIMDKSRIYALYVDTSSPYFYFSFLNTLFGELFKTNLLIYEEEEEGEIIEKEINVGYIFYCFCSDNQYLFATPSE